MTQVRILTDTVINGHLVKCNQVAEVDANTAKTLESDGQGDSNKEAVAYALSQNPKVVDCLTTPAGEETPAADPVEPDPKPPATTPAAPKPPADSSSAPPKE